jgi:hypothetical protein
MRSAILNTDNTMEKREKIKREWEAVILSTDNTMEKREKIKR